VILILIGSIDEVALYSSLELRTSNDSSIQNIFSLLFLIAFVVLTFAVIIHTFYLVAKYQKIKK